MKMPSRNITSPRGSCLQALLLAALTAGVRASAAENAVLLEGFEQNIDSAAAVGGRSTIESYTSTGADDVNVTQGSKSLKVTVSGQEWWAQDLRMTFGDEASARIRAACHSKDVARFILRWDQVYPPSGTTIWMNSQMAFGGVGIMNDQLDSNNAKRTMSVALDLIGENIPADGPITITIAHNFDASEEPFGSFDTFYDNFRIVDTYAPGAKAVVYTLQSFESADNPIGGATGGTRVTYGPYAKQGATDFRVSEGSKSLEVEYASSGWGLDFALPLAGTKLAEILKLDQPEDQRPTQDQLARYTLRWETIYFPKSGISGNWMNTTYTTGGGTFPWSQGGVFGSEEGVGIQKTYSCTLDQVTWNANVEGAPVMQFIANGEWSAPVKMYYDNFRLIDTGQAQTVVQPAISAIRTDAQGKVVITWTGAGTLQTSPTLASPQWTDIAGAASGTAIQAPTGGIAFYRVKVQ